MASTENKMVNLLARAAAFAPSDRFSLIANTVFNNYTEIYTFATSNPTAYAGAIVSALNDETNGNVVYPKGAYYIASWGEGAEVLQVGKETDLSKYYTKTETDNAITTKINDALGTVYKYKGSLSKLPNIEEDGSVKTNPNWTGYNTGDVYNITIDVRLKPYNYTDNNFENNAIIYPMGTNFAFVKGEGNIQPHWDALGGVMNLSDYMKTPKGGNTGQILTKTDNGYDWANAPQSASISEKDNVATIIAGSTSTNVYNTTAIDNWLSWNEIE